MDGYKIKVTRQAKEHLALIREYIATELKEPEIAKRMLDLLKAKMTSLQTKPYRVKCIDEQPWGELGFRKIRVKIITFTFGLMRIKEKSKYSRLFT